MVLLFFCQFISNLCVRRSPTTLQIGNTHEHCAASDMLLVTCTWCYCCRFLGPPWCQRCSDWCALRSSATVAFGCVCSSHVSGWLTSVEVYAAVSTWSVLLVARWNVGAQANCFIAAFGCKRPPRHARTSRVLGVGSQWHGVQMQLTRNRHFLVYSKKKKTPFSS